MSLELNVIYKQNFLEPSNPKVSQGTELVDLNELKDRTKYRLTAIIDMLLNDDRDLIWEYITSKIQDNILPDLKVVNIANRKLIINEDMQSYETNKSSL